LPDSSFSPTARRWELAARLRALRIEAGRSIEDAAAELMCSVAKISRMETAGRGVQPRDIRDLCRLYGVSDAVRDQLMQTAADARKPGWWQEFPSLDEASTTYIGLEAAASEIFLFEALRIPGLLQTPEFSTALIPQLRPPGELTQEWIGDTVAARGKRQERVASGDISVHAIIDEAALQRPVGGPAVMIGQVGRLVAEARRPNVTLQVIPISRGPHPGLDGSFQLLNFPKGLIGDVIFVEGLLGNFLLDKQDVVDHYRTVFQDLAVRFALGVDETLDWLDRHRASLEKATHVKRPSLAG